MIVCIPPLPLDRWQSGLHDKALRLTDVGIKAKSNVYCTLANYPSLFLAWLRLGAYLLRRSTLPDRERELVILRAVARSHGRYPLAQHIDIGRQCGLDDGEIETIIQCRESPVPQSLDNRLTRAVDELVAGAALNDGTWEALRTDLTLHQCLDLVATAAFYRLASWFLNASGTPLEAGKQTYEPAVDSKRITITAEAYNGLPRFAPLAPSDWPKDPLDETSGWPRFKNRPELRQAGVYQTFANHAQLFTAIGGLMAHILDENSLSDRARELVIVRACARARGTYPYRKHFRIGRKAGLSEHELKAAGALYPCGLTGLEQILLDMADGLYVQNDLSNDIWNRAQALLTMLQIMDVIIVSGFYNLVSAMLNVAKTRLEVGEDNLPDHFHGKE